MQELPESVTKQVGRCQAKTPINLPLARGPMFNDTAECHDHASDTQRGNGVHHAVQFYGSDDYLFTTVAGFISEGLTAGRPS
jgi:hypothetical protein